MKETTTKSEGDNYETKLRISFRYSKLGVLSFFFLSDLPIIHSYSKDLTRALIFVLQTCNKLKNCYSRQFNYHYACKLETITNLGNVSY